MKLHLLARELDSSDLTFAGLLFVTTVVHLYFFIQSQIRHLFFRAKMRRITVENLLCIAAIFSLALNTLMIFAVLKRQSLSISTRRIYSKAVLTINVICIPLQMIRVMIIFTFSAGRTIPNIVKIAVSKLLVFIGLIIVIWLGVKLLRSKKDKEEESFAESEKASIAPQGLNDKSLSIS